MRRLTFAALGLAGIGQIVITLMEPDFNTAVGMGIGAAFFLLAALAATGRGWAFGVVPLISALLTVAAVGQLMDRFESGETGEAFRVLAFMALTATAAIAGTVSAVGSYRSRNLIGTRK